MEYLSHSRNMLQWLISLIEKMCPVSHWSLLGIRLWPLVVAVPCSAGLKDTACLEARDDMLFSALLGLQ